MVDMQMVQPGSIAARNYHSWQKLFGKNHALLSGIKIIWQNSHTFDANLNYLAQFTHFCHEFSAFISQTSIFMKFLSEEQLNRNNFYDHPFFSIQKTFHHTEIISVN